MQPLAGAGAQVDRVQPHLHGVGGHEGGRLGGVGCRGGADAELVHCILVLLSDRFLLCNCRHNLLRGIFRGICRCRGRSRANLWDGIMIYDLGALLLLSCQLFICIFEIVLQSVSELRGDNNILLIQSCLCCSKCPTKLEKKMLVDLAKQ